MEAGTKIKLFWLLLLCLEFLPRVFVALSWVQSYQVHLHTQKPQKFEFAAEIDGKVQMQEVEGREIPSFRGFWEFMEARRLDVDYKFFLGNCLLGKLQLVLFAVLWRYVPPGAAESRKEKQNRVILFLLAMMICTVDSFVYVQNDGELLRNPKIYEDNACLRSLFMFSVVFQLIFMSYFMFYPGSVFAGHQGQDRKWFCKLFSRRKVVVSEDKVPIKEPEEA